MCRAAPQRRRAGRALKSGRLLRNHRKWRSALQRYGEEVMPYSQFLELVLQDELDVRAWSAAEGLFCRRRSGSSAGAGRAISLDQGRRVWRVGCCRWRSCLPLDASPALPAHSMERLIFSASPLQGGGHLAGWRWTCPRLGPKKIFMHLMLLLVYNLWKIFLRLMLGCQ